MPSHEPETSSPELDAFLRGAILRRLHGSERRSAVRKIWADDEEARADPFDPETKPHRIMVMWRLARTTAMVKGLCSEDETLESATDVSPNPWVEPFLPIMTASANAALRRQTASRFLRVHAEAEGLPLLPPRGDQAALGRWCQAASILAADLGVERSPKGLLGLQGLLNPKQCARCDVSIDNVIAFEEMILEESLNMMLDKGERAALRHFKMIFGFSIKEAKSLLRIVKAQALAGTAASVEEKRALMEMRLQDHVGRSKETLDMDGEMKALKELAKIQGLTRTSPEDQAMEFFDVIKRVSARQDKETLDSETLTLLNGHRAEEVEPRTIEHKIVDPVDPDDAEALAEYDQENQHR